MATTLLAATVNAALLTTPITVSDATGPVTVTAVCASKIDFDFRAVLQIKGGTVFQDVYDPELITMGKHRMQLCLTAKGTYQISKDATAVAIGFESTP